MAALVDQKTIKFYRLSEPYGEFSNFYKRPIRYNGKLWPSSEHFYQAQKFLDEVNQENVRLCPLPKDAANMGRDPTLPLRADWNDPVSEEDVASYMGNWKVPSVKLVKDLAMWKAVVPKFTQHQDLTTLLIDTKDAIIIEHTKNDRYWGDGGDGTGLNALGRQLMDLRGFLQ